MKKYLKKADVLREGYIKGLKAARRIISEAMISDPVRQFQVYVSGKPVLVTIDPAHIYVGKNRSYCGFAEEDYFSVNEYVDLLLVADGGEQMVLKGVPMHDTPLRDLGVAIEEAFEQCNQSVYGVEVVSAKSVAKGDRRLRGIEKIYADYWM